MNKLSLAEHELLASAWIDLYCAQNKFGRDSDQANILFWAFSKLRKLCKNSPKEAFQVVLVIISLTDDEWILENVAAGPLEDLVDWHGNLLIDVIEQEARSNSKFKDVLGGIWRGDKVKDELWDRLEKLILEGPS